MQAEWLVDKSALVRFVVPEVGRRLADLRERALLARCSMVDLEVLYSARAREWPAFEEERRRTYELVPLDQATFDRAIEVQGLLAQRGQHRLPVPDLVIAAAAELAGIGVLHYDADYDRIAEVTGQRCEWVVPRGAA